MSEREKDRKRERVSEREKDAQKDDDLPSAAGVTKPFGREVSPVRRSVVATESSDLRSSPPG